MNLLKRFFIFLLLFINIFLFGESISSQLKYVQNYKNFGTLTPKDFKFNMIEDEKTNVESGDISILISFLSEISLTGLEMYVNDQEIKNLYYTGSFFSTENAFSVEIKSKLLMEGENKIAIIYFPESGEMEEKQWKFETTSMINQKSLPEQLTESRGWKRYFSASPNGKFIAYVVIEKNKNAILIFNLENKKEYTIIESKKEKKFGTSQKENFFSFAPCWSADSKNLYFISTETESYEIYRATLDLSGEVDTIKQLSDFGNYCSDLVYSNIDDRLYFTSNKDNDLMALYFVEDISKIESIENLNSNLYQFSSEEETASIFSPAISKDAKYIAYCKQEMGSLITIEISETKNSSTIKDEISIDDRDCLYPSWSPENDILAFYCNKSIYLKNIKTDEDPKIIVSDCRMPTYSIKPSWDPSGESIYYVANDQNKSLHYFVINEDGNLVKNVTLIDEKKYRDNMEIFKTPNFKNIIYSSFASGQWQIWTIQQELKNDFSVNSFKFAHDDLLLKHFDPLHSSYFLVGFSPKFTDKNSYWEKENSRLGFNYYKINDKKYTVKTLPFNNKVTIISDYPNRKKVNIIEGVKSTFVPGWGQKSLSLHKKDKFFLYSIGCIAGLAGGSYFLEDKYEKDYLEAKEMGSLVDNKVRFSQFFSIKNSLILTGSVVYFLNVFDAFISSREISTEFREEHKVTFDKLKSHIPQDHQIYGKKLKGKGELKISCSEPRVDVYLKDSNSKDFKHYGRTNYCFDENTFFTITDIEPDNYTLVCKKEFHKPYEENITIKENFTKYSIVDLSSLSSNRFNRFIAHSVPGLTQIKNKKYVKGCTVASIATLSLISSLVCHQKANDEIDSYNSADDISNLIEAKSNYYKYSSYRDSFLLLFSLNYIYNLYDAW
ncbi:MAG: hypothetical protein K8S23_16525 [Candidatus Cloacimonetes bacterium]|nr:hypothetical protein [Candidatus Cloacimonadota bacterium]